jgi:hypothetical protein
MGWEGKIEDPGMDPWGNYRPYGWVHAWATDEKYALNGMDVLDMGYKTVGGSALHAWDVLFEYLKDPANLRIQVFGVDPDEEYEQIPSSD